MRIELGLQSIGYGGQDPFDDFFFFRLFFRNIPYDDFAISATCRLRIRVISREFEALDSHVRAACLKGARKPGGLVFYDSLEP